MPNDGMNLSIERGSRNLDRPLEMAPRILLVAAALLVVPAILLPLWTITLVAPQQPQGLRLEISSDHLAVPNGDLDQVNALHRAIGMRDLSPRNFAEFRWIPFVLGAMGLLFLRGAALGRLVTLVDLFVLDVYFGLFALWSFGRNLREYGSHIAADAPIKVAPFHPRLWGQQSVGPLEVLSSPSAGAYALAGIGLLLAIALLVAWRQARREMALEARVAG